MLEGFFARKGLPIAMSAQCDLIALLSKILISSSQLARLSTFEVFFPVFTIGLVPIPHPKFLEGQWCVHQLQCCYTPRRLDFTLCQCHVH